MLRQPLLTVIMPVYNMEKYLGRALDALMNQEDKNFKLLIINDGSKDKTREIAESYRDKFLYFTLINKKNGGLSDARNVGMNHVDTPYFTFHDGDDWVDPGYTSFFVKAFAKYPKVAMVSCGFWIDSQRRNESHPVDPKKESGLLDKRQVYQKMTNIFTSPVKGYTWNKGYRTEVVRKHHMAFVKDLAFMEDQIFNVKYVSLTDGFYFDSVPLYHYWQRSDSMVHDLNPKKIPDNFRANYRVWHQIIKSLMAERAKQKPNKKAAKKAALGDLDMKN
ncbi:glycosyltransferase family A protein [Lactobacillus hominis]|uniref:Glycosyltransferase family protein n=1 Tax=Lactobacillus hominis DSM 23910 = CRBIP 24.179 TaxID=1423758 RepID=I7IVH0_9LACO|nr:glycosyltransferase family A protein [Lactobacillus hominis]KRM84757.1 glycosyltransferase-like protein [Lactobacillus hominis DSM 23910 = CRBIP 24.179]MCT3347800.1 glycosyltransferase family 2 protein [Lactobacillus hominis]CCI81428.1 Glycosyltransferase family protein [Lactobacillus hominis DSM 23910 = CRBIP 24.179]